MRISLRSLTMLAALFVSVARVAAQPDPSEFPSQVPYELGKSKFAAGDNITITSLRGTRDVVMTNET